MSREEMFKLVCDLLRDTPELEKVDIDWDTDPFTALDKDSNDGIDLACLLSERLGITIDPSENPLVDDQHQRARLVKEVVDWCLNRLQTNSVRN